jgi:RsiW-degrading membrane proteinase PrsW (M82 family)
VSSDNQRPAPDPDGQKRQPTSELWGPWGPGSGEGQESQVVSGTQFKRPVGFETRAERITRPINEAAPLLDRQSDNAAAQLANAQSEREEGPTVRQDERKSLVYDSGEIQGVRFAQAERAEVPQHIDVDPQFTYREHVSGSLASDPSEAPLFRPAYPPYPPYPGYQPPGQGPGYSPQGQNYPALAPGYPPFVGPPPQRPGYSPYGYPSYQGYVSPPPYAPVTPPIPGYNNYPAYAYAYPWQPPKPKRDGYLFAVAISSLVGSILVLLAGLGAIGILALLAAVPHTNLSDGEYFAGVMLFIGLACAGIVGGGFGLYHSIRSVFLRKPSADFAMPQFWIFVLLYLAVLGIAYWLQTQGLAVAYPPVTVVLIALAAIFPALVVLALGDRRLRFPRLSRWPTSWRRFTLAIVSGATLGVGIAAVLEYIFEFLLVRGQTVNPLLCVNKPDAPNCQNPVVYNFILIVVAVMAPLVEETVKPLSVIVLIGRIRSAAEAFVLGLACGIGFDLIETTGYISSGYQDWLHIALIRTGAGLLHGFGAAMVALGWYYLTRPGKNRFLKATGCWLYAIVQHALWNGSWGLILLPAPFGPFFDNLNVTIGSFSLPSYEIFNIVEALFILSFFIYMTGRLRTKTTLPSSLAVEKVDVKSVGEPQKALPS